MTQIILTAAVCSALVLLLAITEIERARLLRRIRGAHEFRASPPALPRTKARDSSVGRQFPAVGRVLGRRE